MDAPLPIEPQTADRRRQRVHALEPDEHLLPDRERKHLDLARGSRCVHRERRRTRTLRAHERRACGNLETQALDCADELQLHYLRTAHDGHGQLIAMLGEHHVLGPNDDGRFVAAAQRPGPTIDLEERLTELDIAEAVRTEQQIRGA